MDERWSEDILGHPFHALTLPLEPDDEGPRVATLVAYEPDAPTGTEEPGPTRAVLYVHGFSDYFFHTELAKALSAQGWAFFALDLHKYGRSLLPGQTPGFALSLEEYDADLEAALAALRTRLAARAGTGVDAAADPEVVLMAHSTGGLTATLWAARNPGRIAALVLNSPWLDTQGSALLRSAAQGILDPLSRRRPKARLRIPALGFYFRSISDTLDGEWPIDAAWRPEKGFPVRAGWLAAVLAGHAALARGVTVDVPVLVLCSTASMISATWNEAMLESDIILDVVPMVRRAAELGHHVTIRRLPGALHDVFLSRPEVRGAAILAATRWMDVQVPAGSLAPVPGPPGRSLPR
ncbi:alpha/beta hydrolase [Arthrobacter sp. Ld5]|uniref:alpha/beta hydrolase n=1 Tax=Arthrobacter sp. Ld5 TaxID=649152 RepID=UPI003EB710D5